MKLHLWNSTPHGTEVIDSAGHRLRALACYIHMKPTWPQRKD